MQAKAAALGNKDSDFLIEVVDAFAGKEVGAMLLVFVLLVAAADLVSKQLRKRLG